MKWYIHCWHTSTQSEFFFFFFVGIITSWIRSSQASWKWVPKSNPAPPWSVGSSEVLPKQTRNMDPPLFISFDLDLRKPAKSVWNCFLYAFAVLSFAPWMNTLPLLYADDLFSTTHSGTWVPHNQIIPFNFVTLSNYMKRDTKIGLGIFRLNSVNLQVV